MDEHEASPRPYQIPSNSPMSLLNEDGESPGVPGCILQDEEGQPVNLASLQGKLVGFYFSAGWCPPCRSFSPQLSFFAKQHHQHFQVIFVSSDRSQAEMEDFTRGKGFLRVRWDSSVGGQLVQYLGVSMLPTLVVCNADTGHVVTHWGRFAMMLNQRNCLQEWRRGYNGISLSSFLGLGNVSCLGGDCSM
mmetsp:Transcript_19220/g.26601  ORF Transcript_19220/g.26601 Transcript_19220/m.26601 type:complete len:190 (-) Transcript_19220:194-763(-)